MMVLCMFTLCLGSLLTTIAVVDFFLGGEFDILIAIGIALLMWAGILYIFVP